MGKNHCKALHNKMARQKCKSGKTALANCIESTGSKQQCKKNKKKAQFSGVGEIAALLIGLGVVGLILYLVYKFVISGASFVKSHPELAEAALA